MANGQQIAVQSVDNFKAWMATQASGDYKQIIYRGQLSRREVAKAVGCGARALTQNDKLAKLLSDLEDSLRERGVLPPLTTKAKAESGKDIEFDQTASSRIRDSKRMGELEQANIELEAKVNELSKKLEKFQELSKSVEEIGIVGR